MDQHRLGIVEFDWSKVEAHDAPEMSVLFRRSTKRRIIAVECANCGARSRPRANSPYCSVRCRDQAKYVRYARAKRREYGNEMPLDIQYALWIKRVHALGDGYDESLRRIPQMRRREVWERDDGLCVNCGQPGNEIDHRDGPSNDLPNLCVLCKPCHHEKTGRKVGPIRDLPRLIDSTVLRTREEIAEPLKACDAPDWQQRWRDWRREHAVYSE